MHSEKEKEYRRNYNKRHQEAHRRHSKTYRVKHIARIAEYNRLNPELRVRLPLDVYEHLRQHYGKDLAKTVRAIILRDVYLPPVPL